MKTYYIYIILFLSVFVISGKSTSRQHSVLKTVVIDAGHGGKDSGCRGATNSKEKEVTLAIALSLGKKIKAIYPSVNVIYTREKDIFVELHKRAKIANDHKADLFISIHCNAAVTRKQYAYGSETYALGLHRADDNLEIMKRENDVILMEDNYENNYDYDPNSPEIHIINALVQNKHLEQSLNFATKIEREFVLAKRKSRGVKQAGFAVLRNATMPAVLIESGFLTHSTEEAFLTSKAGQNQMADAIFNAFVAYKNELEADAIPETLTARSPDLSTIKISQQQSDRLVREGFEFKIQLAAVSNLENPNLAALIDAEIVEIVEENKVKKIITKSYDSYQAANESRQLWIEEGFKDAFIVVYKNGVRVPSSALNLNTE